MAYKHNFFIELCYKHHVVVTNRSCATIFPCLIGIQWPKKPKFLMIWNFHWFLDHLGWFRMGLILYVKTFNMHGTWIMVSLIMLRKLAIFSLNVFLKMGFYCYTFTLFPHKLEGTILPHRLEGTMDSRAHFQGFVQHRWNPTYL